MKTALYVISDLHLGGLPGADGAPGFQMCPPRNQKRLADFLSKLPPGSDKERVRLVVAGDVVDFLAEREFDAFTRTERAACDKLSAILERTKPIWDALRAFVTNGGAVTLMLGNHDVEMCLPAVRRLLLETIGKGEVEFLYDNEAFTQGPILIEHGNRYDSWNAVPHNSLRRARSRLSRGLPVNEFDPMPGSQLVTEVMNELKAEYSWVDLLKPENAGTLPILAALGAGNLPRVWKAYQKYRQSTNVEFAANFEPDDPEYIAATAVDTDAASSEQAMFDLAQDITAGGSAEQVSAVGDFLAGARDKVSEVVRQARRSGLRRALRALAEYQNLTFNTDIESETYLNPAKAAASRGFEVIVYGHTHLVKNVDFEWEPGKSARYINTGTWADLMRMPDAIFGVDKTASESSFGEFVADLENDDVGRWRRAAPTFALIEVDGDHVVSSDVKFADETGSESATTKGLLQRLQPEAKAASERK